MAQQDISIARAIFITSLLRPESKVPDVSRQDATLFARALSRACNRCTSSNIKPCTSFTVKNILPSPIRTIALAKHLLTLCKSFAPQNPGAIPQDSSKASDDRNEGLNDAQQPPEPAFKRLHLLYIVHDILVNAHLHPGHAGAVETLKSELSSLASLTACGCGSSTKAARTVGPVLDLITYWQRIPGLLPEDQLRQLREAVAVADKTSWDSTLAKIQAQEDTAAQEFRRLQSASTRYVLPTRHGVASDPAAPWHELPAGNGLYMHRVYGHPLHASAIPQGGFPVPGGGNEAEEDLKNGVERLYNEVLRCYDKYTKADEVHDVDALGNIVWKDPERPTRNFWGFTLDGVERRRELAKRFKREARGYEGLRKMGEDGRGTIGAALGSDSTFKARALTAERGRGMGRERGYGSGRGGWRGGRRW